MPNAQKITDLAVVAQQVQTLLEGAGVDYSVSMWTSNNEANSNISVSKRTSDDGMPF